MTVDRRGAHFRRHGKAALWTPDDYTAGGTGTVIFDAPGQDLLGGAVQSIEYEVLYQVSEFVGMDEGDELEIELNATSAPEVFTAFTVRTITPVDDGELMSARLTKV